MTSKAPLFFALAFVSLNSAQSPEDHVSRALHFTSTGTDAGVAEIENLIRNIAGIQRASIDTRESALVLQGTATQIALAEWLFRLLDLPTGAPVQNSTNREYRVSANPDDVVRVFYLSNTTTVPSFQELVTAVNGVTHMGPMFTYYALRIVAARGTADQVALADFFFAQMDKPPALETSQSPPAPEYRMPNGPDNVARVYYLPNVKTVTDFQSLTFVARVATNVPWLFTYNQPRAAAARATTEQLDIVGWLFDELGQPANLRDSGPHEYRLPDASDDVVRVFYLTPTLTVERLEEIANQIRPRTEHRLAMTYHVARAIVVRGNSAQIALADKIVKEQDQ
jgi:hypothetical protein